jgi:lysophospholipase L1-like esterase
MPFLKKLTIFLLATLVILAVVEIALRLFGFGGLERYVYDRDLLWRLAPNQKTHTKAGHFPVRTNSMGMRSPEASCEKADDVFRVIVFGDSYTFGWGVRQDETYAAQLQKLLQTAWPDRRVEVWNAGCNAYSVYQQLVFLKKLLPCRPDLVIFSNTFNEGLLPEIATLDAEQRQRIARAVALKNFLRRFALYNFLVEVQGKVVYLKIRSKIVAGSWSAERPPDAQIAEMVSQLREAEQICRENGVGLMFLVTSGGAQNEAGPFQQAMLDLAEEDGVPVVNTISRLRGAPRDRYWVADGHPNAAGHLAMAEAVSEIILQNTWHRR